MSIVQGIDQISNLRERLISAFRNHYLLNDEGHREEHFEEVFQTGVHINKTLNLGYNEELILIAAYIHDLFAWSRNNHHFLSCEFVESTDHPIIVEFEEDRKIIAEACFTHRASYKGNFRYPFAELINSADRCRPGTVEDLLKRAIQYREGIGFQGTKEELYTDAIAHLKDKHGTKGYARYPDMYMKCFGEQLMKLQQEVDKL